MKKKLVLIDGNSLLFRAYFATSYTNMMKTSYGVATNAIYSFANMIDKIIEIQQPDYIAVSFDAGKKTFRHQIYADYKAGRKETPGELIQQFEISREFLDAYGIAHYEIDGIEADDIVGTMSKKTFSDCQVEIYSSDRDLLQLIDENVNVNLIIKGLSDVKVMDLKALYDDKMLIPSQITDLKGLSGDKSDNIPGIPGVGEVSALKLLQQYQTVENIVANVDQLKGKLQEKVSQYGQQALLCKQLATIKTDVQLPFTIDNCLYNPNYNLLYSFYLKYEMNKMANKVSDKLTDTINIKNTDNNNIVKVKTIDKDLLTDNMALVLDIDTQLYGQFSVYGLAIGNNGKKQYIDIEDLYYDKATLQWLQDDGLHKYVFDLKRLLHGFDSINIPVKGISDDVMLLAFLCDSTCNNAAKINLNYHLSNEITLENIYGKADKPKMRDEGLVLTYINNLINDIYTLKNVCDKKIKEIDCVSLYKDIELPLTYILKDMETQGIICKKDILQDIAVDLDHQLNQLMQQIYDIVGQPFNINSPKQLANILFDQLKLPLINNKKRSTSAEVLEELQGFHPVIDYLLQYRKISKLYSTYAIGLEKYIGSDSKIHTTFNQIATQTGRLSSSDPNLQNISVRNEQGKLIRKCFLPSDGCVLLSCDYSQVELRMLASIANEEKMIDAFNHDIDIHTKTAMDVFHLTKDQVDSEHRRRAKAVNFGIVYGISDFGLAAQLAITRKEANDFIQSYLQTYPRISQYMDSIVKSCQDNGYVTTLLNRRREIPEIYDKSYTMRSFGKRAAMNAPIQGSAADLIKIAMIKVDQAMKKANVKSKMLLQVHDELIFDVYKDEIEIMTKLVKETMESAMTLKVPLKADCKIGNTWYEAK